MSGQKLVVVDISVGIKVMKLLIPSKNIDVDNNQNYPPAVFGPWRLFIPSLHASLREPSSSPWVLGLLGSVSVSGSEQPRSNRAAKEKQKGERGGKQQRERLTNNGLRVAISRREG